MRSFASVDFIKDKKLTMRDFLNLHDFHVILTTKDYINDAVSVCGCPSIAVN